MALCVSPPEGDCCLTASALFFCIHSKVQQFPKWRKLIVTPVISYKLVRCASYNIQKLQWSIRMLDVSAVFYSAPKITGFHDKCDIFNMCGSDCLSPELSLSEKIKLSQLCSLVSWSHPCLVPPASVPQCKLALHYVPSRCNISQLHMIMAIILYLLQCSLTKLYSHSLIIQCHSCKNLNASIHVITSIGHSCITINNKFMYHTVKLLLNAKVW